MPNNFLEAPGKKVDPDELSFRRSLEIIRSLQSGALPYAHFVEARRDTESTSLEVVVVDLDVERGQIRINDISKAERVAICFRPEDDRMPEVLALRADFPSVPHLNQRPTEFPRSLCLYDRDWSELKLRWAAAPFLERIRFWLAQTSSGNLHASDQPLEPLLFGGGYRIVVPSDIFSDAVSLQEQRLSVHFAADDAKVLIARRPSEGDSNGQFVATVMVTEPQLHGVIRHTPANLKELHQFLLPAGLDLIGNLRQRMRAWQSREFRDLRLILVMGFPKKRDVGGAIESMEVFSFLCLGTISAVGQAIGSFYVQDGQLCLLMQNDESKTGENVAVEVLTTHFALSRARAARMNGLSQTDDRAMVAAGVGAIGSQVLENLCRAATGRWTLVDEDVLLPHNLTRHALNGFYVGLPKAQSVAAHLNSIFDDTEPQRPVAGAIHTSVLRPGTSKEILDKALAEAKVILDMSASLPVARHLAREILCPARRVSLFLNPSGDNLVLLAKDPARKFGLDALEVQYYRSVASRTELNSHLLREGKKVRYGQSCRDLSSVIPQDYVALLSAVGSAAFRAAVTSDKAAIKIWQLSPDSLEVQSISIKPSVVVERAFGNWTLVTDHFLLQKVQRLRRRKLPKETGGVLLGHFDLERHVVYVVDTIPSPPDSKEWPWLYIRGHEALPQMVASVKDVTAGNLEYCGEWHSHPDGVPPLPSSDDIKVFSWLTESVDPDGLPALMLIVGEKDQAFYLGEMKVR